MDGVSEKPRPRPREFFASALTDEERELLPLARRMSGLKEEIAAMRVRLRTAIKEHPEDLRLLSFGISVLVRAVAAQYRLSPKARRDLASNFAATLNSLGDQILPPDA